MTDEQLAEILRALREPRIGVHRIDAEFLFGMFFSDYLTPGQQGNVPTISRLAGLPESRTFNINAGARMANNGYVRLDTLPAWFNECVEKVQRYDS